jgi:hypothetical protein
MEAGLASPAVARQFAGGCRPVARRVACQLAGRCLPVARRVACQLAGGCCQLPAGLRGDSLYQFRSGSSLAACLDIVFRGGPRMSGKSLAAQPSFLCSNSHRNPPGERGPASRPQGARRRELAAGDREQDGDANTLFAPRWAVADESRSIAPMSAKGFRGLTPLVGGAYPRRHGPGPRKAVGGRLAGRRPRPQRRSPPGWLTSQSDWSS